jgi:hypothetical protein
MSARRNVLVSSGNLCRWRPHPFDCTAEQWVRERRGKRIRMNVVNVRDALIAWYLRRGYNKTGDTEPFPYGDDRFGAPLRDDLSFLVLAKDL